MSRVPPATEILQNAAPRSMLVHPLTLAAVLIGGVRGGRGRAMRDDLEAEASASPRLTQTRAAAAQA